MRQAYHDLLGRPTDPQGLAAFSGQLDHGVSRTDVALAIMNTAEFRTKVVQHLYGVYLRRQADPAGLNTFVGIMGQGGERQVRAAILASQEYFLTRGGGTNAGFLNALYGDVLGRQPDPQARAQFEQALAGGQPRAALVQAVLNSNEANQDLVQSFFRELLGRVGSGERQAYATRLGQGARDEQVVAGIVGSDEYCARATAATGPARPALGVTEPVKKQGSVPLPPSKRGLPGAPSK